jgi:WD40 repeat protein/serine/threonine protein kinase
MQATDLTRDRCPTCGGDSLSGRCTPCLLRLGLDFERGNPVEPDEVDLNETIPEENDGDFPAVPGRFADYELIEQIGRGAMGVVFKARQRSLDRLVALKVLDLAEKLPADAAKRFRVEASAAASLRHPGIVAIHEVGVHERRHYLAMDLVEGATLATVVAVQPLSSDRAARLLAAVADAIQCAHERGILHRDLKPTNILVDAADQPRVADFGLAKRMDADADMTIPGHIMGSPNYMSPEQARGLVLGPTSDVHALGAVLYHCLSGRPPFVGQTIPETLHRVIHDDAVALRLLVGGVPRDLDTVALKCLEKDPAKRYANARSLADDLRRFLRREPISARPAGRSERLWRWCRRRPAIAFLSCGIAVLGLALAIGSPVAALRIRAERERAMDNLYAADMNLAQQAVEKSSRGQARALLERHRPVPGMVDRRGFEWRYIWTHSQTNEREIGRATWGQRHIVTIPGTNLFAAGAEVWERALPARNVFTMSPDRLALAYDGTTKSLLIGTPSGLAALSIATWQSRELLNGEGVYVVALSADARWMATGGAQKLRLWAREADSWRPVASRELAFIAWQNAQTLAFSRDGSFLVSGTGAPYRNRCTLDFWSVPTLEKQPGLPSAPRDVLSLAMSPDGRQLVTGSWSLGRIRVWDLATMTESAVTMHHPGGGYVLNLKFSPNDADVFASSASDRTVRLWSLRTGDELVVQQGPLDELWAMAFSDGDILTLERSGRIAAWDVTTHRGGNDLITSGLVTVPLGFTADGATLATIDEMGGLRFWDVAQRRELDAKKQDIDFTGVFTDFEIIAPAITRDHQTLAVGMEDGRVQLWDLASRTAHTLSAHAKRMRNVAFSPDGRTLATVADDGILKVWNVASRTLLHAISIPGALAPRNVNAALVWSSDGRVLAIANDTAIMLHDAANGRLLRTLDPKGLVYSLRFSPDDRLLVSAQQNHQMAFWDTRSGALLDLNATSHQEGAYDICFSPDGRTFVTVVDQVKLWSVATRQEVSTLRGHQHNIFAALFSPTGNLFVTADYGGGVRFWAALPFEAMDGDLR